MKPIHLPLLLACLLMAALDSFAQAGRKQFVLNFNDSVIFERPLDFREGEIIIKHLESDPEFALSQPQEFYLFFKKKVNFQHATFISNADFTSSQFSDTANFSGAKFLSNSDFSDLEFLKTTDFSRTVFQKTVGFYDATFKDVADFSNSQFNDTVGFASYFENTADFSKSTFRNVANFNYSSFRNIADFSKLTISPSTHLHFSNTKFPRLIDFSDNEKIFFDVVFRAGDFRGKQHYPGYSEEYHYINLRNTDIAKVRFDYEHFRLCFYSRDDKEPGFGLNFAAHDSISVNTDFGEMKYPFRDYRDLLKINSVRVYLKRVFPLTELTDSVVSVFLTDCIERRRLPATLSTAEITSIYQQVLKNFEENGQKESYETLDIEYQDFKNGWFTIPHIWNCYGYHKEWIFYWSFSFILLFTLVTFCLLDRLNGRSNMEPVYHLSNIPVVLKHKTRLWFFRRLWYSLMYTSTIFFLLTLKVDKLNFKKGLVAYILIVYAVGLLCLAYMANFVLQK